MVEKMIKVENRKLSPKNGEVGDDVKICLERERERSEGKSPLIWVEWDVHIVEASGKDNALKLWLNVILMLKEENDFRIRCHILEKKKDNNIPFVLILLFLINILNCPMLAVDFQIHPM